MDPVGGDCIRTQHQRDKGTSQIRKKDRAQITEGLTCQMEEYGLQDKGSGEQ